MKKKRGLFILAILLIIVVIVVVAIWFNQDSQESATNDVTPPSQVSQEEFMDMSVEDWERLALDFYENSTGHRPNSVASAVDENGNLAIQLYDSLEDHNSTCDYYTVDRTTGIAMDIMGNEIDLRNGSYISSNSNEMFLDMPVYEWEQLALDFYEQETGYRPSSVGSELNEEGDLMIQLYDNLGDHNSTSDYYVVNGTTGIATNMEGKEIDLRSGSYVE